MNEKLKEVFWESIKDYQDDPKRQAEILYTLILELLASSNQKPENTE